MSDQHKILRSIEDPVLVSPEYQAMVHRQLILLIHASECKNEAESENSMCLMPYCRLMKQVTQHFQKCEKDHTCETQYCYSSKRLMLHYNACREMDCPTCYVVNLPVNLWPEYASQRSAKCIDTDEEEESEENQEAEGNDLRGASDIYKRAYAIFKRLESIEAEAAVLLVAFAERHIKRLEYPHAIYYLKRCLQVQELFLKSDDRFCADLYYQIGIVQLSTKQYLESLKSIRTAQTIISLKLQKMREAAADGADCNFASSDKDAEVSELENALLHIQKKIEDTEELINNMEEL